MPRGAVVLAGIAALSILAAAASAARQANTEAALTRAQADAIAVRTLRPQADRGDVILFGLPAALPKGSIVAPADPPKGGFGLRAQPRVAPLAAPAWLYWLDREPYARYSHDSEYALVDAESGRIVRRARIGWYPTINARDPAFVATSVGFESRRYRVYQRIARLPSAATSGAAPVADVLPKDAFAKDCVLMVGDYDDHLMKNDFRAVAAWARSVGIRTFYAAPGKPRPSRPRTAPDGENFVDNVAALAADERCNDILIYMSGHGQRRSNGSPAVGTGRRFGLTGRLLRPIEVTHIGITDKDVELAISSNPKTTFKLKIDSCYAGRFVDTLTVNGKPRLPNLLVIEASSSATQISESLPASPKTAYPEKMGAFTRGNLVGLKTWASSRNEVASSLLLGGSLLANALARAFELGRPANASIKRGKTPLIAVNINRPPEVNGFEATRTGTHTLYRVTARDPEGGPLRYAWTNSNACGTFSGDGPAADWDHPHPPCPNETSHAATITVKVSDGFWDCAVDYLRGSDAAARYDPQERCARR